MDASTCRRDALLRIPGALAAVFRLLAIFPVTNQRVRSTVAELEESLAACRSDRGVSVTVHSEAVRVADQMLPEPKGDQQWEWFRALLDEIPLAGIRVHPPIDMGELARLSQALLVARRGTDGYATLTALSEELETVEAVSRHFHAHRFDAAESSSADVDGVIEERWGGIRDRVLRSPDLEGLLENARRSIERATSAEIHGNQLLQDLLERLPAESLVDEETAAQAVIGLLRRAVEMPEDPGSALGAAQVYDQIARGFFRRSMTPQEASESAAAARSENATPARKAPPQPATDTEYEQLLADIDALPEPEVPETLIDDSEIADILVTCFATTTDPRARANALAGLHDVIRTALRSRNEPLLTLISHLFGSLLQTVDDDGYARLWGDEFVLELLLRRNILSARTLATRLPLGVDYLIDQIEREGSPALKILESLCESCSPEQIESLRLALSVAFVATPERARVILRHYTPRLAPTLAPLVELVATEDSLKNEIVELLRRDPPKGHAARWIRLAPKASYVSNRYVRSLAAQLRHGDRRQDLEHAAAKDLTAYLASSNPADIEPHHRTAIIRYAGEFQSSELRDALRQLNRGGLFRRTGEPRPARDALRELFRSEG